MVTDEKQTILVVHLDEADLSLGQLGALLRDLQSGVRNTATAIDKTPAIGTVRVTGFKEGSLEFVVQVIGWLPHVTFDVGGTVVELADRIASLAATAIAGRWVVEGARTVLRRYILSSRRGAPPEQVEEALAALDALKEARDRRDRDIIWDISRRIECDPERVEAAVRAVEAQARANGLIAVSGGGRISSPPADRQVRIVRRA